MPNLFLTPKQFKMIYLMYCSDCEKSLIMLPESAKVQFPPEILDYFKKELKEEIFFYKDMKCAYCESKELSEIDEIFWGGQAGGGKTEGLLMFILNRRMKYPGSVGLMMRRTFSQLEKTLIRKSKKYFSPFAKWNQAKKQWIFHNGSIEECGYCETDNDVYQYDSAEYDDICIDEARHTTEFQLVYLSSRLRTSEDRQTLLRVSSNPGGVGHLWLKERFVIFAKDKVCKAWDEEELTYKTRLFMPATLEDNTLMPKKKRIEYRAWLSGLPESERKMLRDGDWDYMAGAAFPELDRKVHSYNPIEHKRPEYAKIFMSYDFGFGRPFALCWYWIDYDSRIWLFDEWYGWNGKANQGLRMATSQVAAGILQREKIMRIEGQVNYRIAGHDTFSKTPNVRGGGQGPSISEIMSEHGVHFTPGDPDRMLGKAQVHERLRVPDNFDKADPLTYPMMMISEDCKQFWRTIPPLALDDNNIEDIDPDQEAHIYDSVKIACMSRPMTPQRLKPEDSRIQKIIKKVHDPKPKDELAVIYDY